jgi:hypothetical protein
MEQASSAVRTYECQFVPGLLQTADYARGLIGLGRDDEDEVERRVELRMRRGEVLRRPGAPALWAVIDEAALRRPLGGPALGRAQLTYLIEQAERPNVQIQIAQFACGAHPAASGSFTILEMANPDLSGVVYMEQLTSAVYLDRRIDVDHYQVVMGRLVAQLPPPEHTAEILASIRDQF